MKKNIFLIFCCIIFFVSCNQKQENENYEFPKTTWGMSMFEVLEAYGLNVDDMDETLDKYYYVLKNQNIFGETSDEIRFYFVDLSGDDSTLCRVEVVYPEDANMNKVLKNMKKTYGKTIPELNVFGYYLAIDSVFSKSPHKESEALKLWASATLEDTIPVEQLEKIRKTWVHYQKPIIEDDNWKIFLEEAHLVDIAWTNNDEISIIKGKDSKSNKLFFDGINSVMYDYFLSSLLK